MDTSNHVRDVIPHTPSNIWVHLFCTKEVRPPGQSGRSWCSECEDFIIPILYEMKVRDLILLLSQCDENSSVYIEMDQDDYIRLNSLFNYKGDVVLSNASLSR